MANDPLFQESIDHITANITAPISTVPIHLLEYWYTPEDVIEYLYNQDDASPFDIFLHAFNTYHQTLGKEIQFSILDSMAMFGQFQLLIALALDKETGVTCNPVRLFDFDNYSSLNITAL